MKSVLISIQPKWVEKIASGEKTIEVRKTRPKLETPFKVYIYCTKGKDLLREVDCWNTKAKIHTTNYKIINLDYCTNKIANGKVIGEFVCDRVDERWFYISTDGVPITDIEKDFEALCCLKRKEIINYALQPNKAVKVHNGTMFIYGWHISDLKIYDKPKELSEFRKPCPYTDGTYCIENKCEYYGDWTGVCRCWVERPPQSWCYVEELK